MTMFEEAPEPLDEDDPEVQDELHATLFEMGTKPCKLLDPTDRKAYLEWIGRNG